MLSRKIFILLLCTTTVTNVTLYSAEELTSGYQKNPALSALALTGSGICIAAAGVGLGIADYTAREIRCADKNYALRASECNDENSGEEIFQVTASLVYSGALMAAAGTSWLAWEGLKTASSYSWKTCKTINDLTSRAFYTTTKNACSPARTQMNSKN